MPTELRHVLFRPSEVIAAIIQYQRHMGYPLPPGTILSHGLEPGEVGGAVRYGMVVAPDRPRPDEPPRRKVEVEGPALAAALILYCRERRIPLPAKADKSVQRFGDQLGLVVTIGSREEENSILRTDAGRTLHAKDGSKSGG